MKSAKKIISAAICAAVCFSLCSCGKEIAKGKLPDTASTTASETKNPDGDKKPVSVTTIEKAEIVPEEVTYAEFSENFFASDGETAGGVTFSEERKGFISEGGYATGFTDPAADDWSITVTLPETQYYNIALSVGADSDVTNSILVDGVVLETFKITGGEAFQNIIFENIYMSAGEYVISFGLLDGGFDLDRLVIAASDQIEKTDLNLEKPVLSFKSPSENAEKVYDFICGIYGKKILSGQYVTPGSDAEIQAIYEETGRYPAIRFSDLMGYTSEEIPETDEIAAAEKWWSEGGIPGFVWHWAAPMDESSFYSSETEFDLSAAVTSLDISLLDFEKIADLCDNRLVSEECVELVRDIDLVAEKLKILAEKDVPVLFRPLNEASGGWFWWGKDKDSYLWLWELLYTRFTEYHGLNNLIWIWNAQSPDWYVGDKLCDMISADIYDSSSTERQINAFISLNEISKSKPVALSECDKILSPETLARDKTMWSFFGFWSGDYIIDGSGNLNEKHISNDALRTVYNNSLILTRDDLEF